MLEQLFAGNAGMPTGEPCLTEAPWTMVELKKAIAPFPRGYVGIVTIVSDGTHWRSAETLPKTKENKSTSDFRPSAVVRLFFKTFAYLVLGRIKATLDAGQPEEQHVAYNKPRARGLTLSLDVPWIVSLNLWKAFDVGKA